MSVFTRQIGADGWPGGCVPATDSTLGDILVSPRARNSALALSTTGKPYIQKRSGLALSTTTPITGSPAIIGQFLYRRISTNANYHLLVSNAQRLDYQDADGTLHTISATAFTTGDLYPDFAVANDLCFIVNGTDKKKLVGTSLQNFGITRPTVGTMAGAAGAAGSPNGTYELRVAYGNSTTGAISSASDTAAATVTVVSQKISVTNIPVSADAQVDRRFIYIRNTATQSVFYLAATITDNVATTVTLDFVDTNLTTLAPSTTENNPPPSGSKYLAFHQGRLFVATDTGLYWSKVNTPEAFDPNAYDGVNASDGQKIKGLIATNDVLIIFKEDSFYTLQGNDPNTWTITRADADYGLASHRTLWNRNGWTWWYSRHGICRWNGGGGADPIGKRTYGDPTDTVNYANIAAASAAPDDANSRICFALPEVGQTRATMILPMNTTNGLLESDKWDPMDVASLGVGLDSSGIERPFLGNYAGQNFQLWSGNNDGVPSTSNVTGTFVPAASSFSTISDASATFLNTGGKLIERKITIFDSNGRVMTSDVRPYVTGNTGTVLTLSATQTGYTAGATYTYEIGGPAFEVDTPWIPAGRDPWVKGRYEWFFLLTRGIFSTLGAGVKLIFDYDDNLTDPKTLSIATLSGLSTWDSGMWDISVWDSPTTAESKYRVARVGKVWKARVYNYKANQPCAILRIGMRSVTQTIKS